jgi:predicted phosphodiesterase
VIGVTASAPILFAGDPHRNFAPILRACAARPAGTLVLLGDCDCDRPLPELLAPALQAGWDVRWILGNRDTDTVAAYDALVAVWPQGDLGSRVASVHGVRIAGLGGVFKPRVWHPVECEPPQVHSRAALLRELPQEECWRGGLPLRHRDTIFPEDFAALRGARFDVLVTHEAPSSHRHGFAAIDALAAQGGARWIVHGHHHQPYSAVLPNGISVRGLGIAECWEFAAQAATAVPGRHP